jgi:hypothetical protein
MNEMRRFITMCEAATLCEGKLVRFHYPYEDREVIAIQNPSPDQLTNLFRKYGESLRGILGKHIGLYAWDANVTHDEFMKQTQIGDGGDFLILLLANEVAFKTGAEDATEWAQQELPEIEVCDRPIRQAYGGRQVTYVPDIDGEYM